MFHVLKLVIRHQNFWLTLPQKNQVPTDHAYLSEEKKRQHKNELSPFFPPTLNAPQLQPQRNLRHLTVTFSASAVKNGSLEGVGMDIKHQSILVHPKEALIDLKWSEGEEKHRLNPSMLSLKWLKTNSLLCSLLPLQTICIWNFQLLLKLPIIYYLSHLENCMCHVSM